MVLYLDDLIISKINWPSSCNTNDAAKALISHLQNICTEAGLLSCHNKSSERAINNQEWFDSECVSMKRKKCKLLNDFRATSNADILQEYVKTKQNFNKLCETKQKQHKENKKTELCNIAKTGDSCKFWKLIKSVISKSNIPRSNISSEEWKTYFSDLLNPEIIDKDVNFSEFVDNFVQAHNTECDLCIDENFSYLDSDITSEEILSEIKKLKNNKSPGEDGLSGEFYKCLSSTLLPVLLKLFNEIFHTGDFPECWSTAIVVYHFYVL
ncbi:unnamed protein product [Mytilus edulis]|uniref:Reverse transcriptase domain-containing protein n=1 Tax=Mytilus edulis TaxID=6550 RepID=A0A8S3TBI5_MYTED|nr:unnamed protein product [Mytilus edulis]